MTGPKYIARPGWVDSALQIATKLSRNEPLTSIERHFTSDALVAMANDVLTRGRPAHRVAENAGRNFWATMDYLTGTDTQAAVAARWGISEGKQLATIMIRGWRVECETALAGVSADRPTWRRMIEAQLRLREKRLQK